ncbi:MAG: type I glyceraldehyde-3-phosphate dehydrogenase, partial [Pseudomonadota bacterium]
MATKVAINGFGRIGRLVARALLERDDHDLELVSINDLADTQANALLFQYDSTHGRFPGTVEVADGAIVVNGKSIAVTSERDPANLPHAAQGVDVVLECTGFFQSHEAAEPHLTAGAKRVLISAPAKNVSATIVYGVNHETLTGEDVIVSNASCTTNCLAPVAKVLNDTVGIERGFMTTIHSYTNDQRMLDQMHKDMRRARGGAQSMIPTTTGAARAVGLVLPELAGKLDGSSVRVPTPNVSLVDLTFTPKRDTSVEELNESLSAAADGPMAGVLDYTTDPLVSADFNHHPASSTVDSLETSVME